MFRSTLLFVMYDHFALSSREDINMITTAFLCITKGCREVIFQYGWFD